MTLAATATSIVVFLAQQPPPQSESGTFLRGALVMLFVALALIAMFIWWMKRNA